MPPLELQEPQLAAAPTGASGQRTSSEWTLSQIALLEQPPFPTHDARWNEAAACNVERHGYLPRLNELRAALDKAPLSPSLASGSITPPSHEPPDSERAQNFLDNMHIELGDFAPPALMGAFELSEEPERQELESDVHGAPPTQEHAPDRPQLLTAQRSAAELLREVAVANGPSSGAATRAEREATAVREDLADVARDVEDNAGNDLDATIEIMLETGAPLAASTLSDEAAETANSATNERLTGTDASVIGPTRKWRVRRQRAHLHQNAIECAPS